MARAFVLIPHRRMAGADAQVGGRDHHRHRGLADVVLVGHLPAFTRRHRQDECDGGRGTGDMTGALPDRGKFLQLSLIGDDDKVPRLAVLRRRRPPSGLGDTVQVVFRHRLRLVLPHIASGTNRIPGFQLAAPSCVPASIERRRDRDRVHRPCCRSAPTTRHRTSRGRQLFAHGFLC